MAQTFQSFPPLPVEDLDQILRQTSVLWEEARGKSFFITGGTGFFGTWLLESFAHINEALDLRARAVVVSRNPAAFNKKLPHLADRPGIEFIEGDVRSFLFPEGKFDYLIHAATDVSSYSQTDPGEMLGGMTSGTKRVLDFAAYSKINKLLLTSSGAVYGTQPPDLTHIPESYLGAPDPTLGSSAYGEGKRISEFLAAAHAHRHQYEVKIARCFAFVGPHLPLNSVFAIGNFIRDALAGAPIKIRGNGSPRRSYLYAADLATWLWTLLFKGPSHRIYHVGSDEDLSISELAHLVCQTLGNRSNIEIASVIDPTIAVLRYVPSISRAAGEQNLGIETPLPQAILKTARWVQQTYSLPILPIP